MEEQKKLEIQGSQDLIDWLMHRGLGLQESATVLCHLTCGDTLQLGILKVFITRSEKLEKSREKYSVPDWGNPITP